ncbi:malonate decarboxylase subunit delta [Rhizobium sp.]|jgi:malonate decarboxylase delta subunit|uniref:malonate decarboxylase subunit delta n=1 Tax=Rhizobium sp. TaxID=391 RepID=UPI000E95A21A|nr:malonate decarboxylase acyl carrier protein [Rhizobium sp.]
MEILKYDYPAAKSDFDKKIHVGVVGSGDLEVLMEPSTDGSAHVVVTTSVNGYGAIWKSVIDRFFTQFEGAALIEINDFGATPGMVALRLQQAVESSK